MIMWPLQFLQLICMFSGYSVDVVELSRDGSEHGVDEGETVSVNPP